MSDEWRSRAACAAVDPELFFPVGHSPADMAQARDAKAVCHRCPVIDSCLDWSITFRPRLTDGIFAGLDGDERKAAGRRRERQAKRPPKPRPATARERIDAARAAAEEIRAENKARTLTTVANLAASGWSAREIGARIGLKERQVQRYLARVREEART